MDKIAIIKDRWALVDNENADPQLIIAQTDIFFLLRENEQLRTQNARMTKVEDAAIALQMGYAEFGDFDDDVSAWGDRVDELCETLERNPRPEKTS